MKKAMPKEILKFRADPVLRRAIKLRAALDDVDLQAVIVRVLRTGLAAEIGEVQQRGLVTEQTGTPEEPKKPGRKRKNDE
jgi:hypothetical protein